MLLSSLFSQKSFGFHKSILQNFPRKKYSYGLQRCSVFSNRPISLLSQVKGSSSSPISRLYISAFRDTHGKRVYHSNQPHYTDHILDERKLINGSDEEEKQEKKEKEKGWSKEYIFVPYDEKDIAKNLGAMWDADNKSWYITDDNIGHEKFKRWKKKTFLQVPYKNKDEGIIFLSIDLFFYKTHEQFTNTSSAL